VAAACTFPEIQYVMSGVGSDGGAPDDSASADVESASDDVDSPSADVGSAPPPGPDALAGDERAAEGGDDAALPDAAVPEDDGPPILPDDSGGIDAGHDSGICACGDGGMYPTHVACSGLAGLLCGQAAGFTGSPACGQSGQYVQCSLNGLACSAAYTTRLQQCRP
jgi:hypothetical protein